MSSPESRRRFGRRPSGKGESGASEALSGRARLCGTVLLLAGLSGCAGLTWLAWKPIPTSEQAIPFVVLYGVLFVIYLLGLRWLRARSWGDARKIGLIVSVATVLRLLLLPAPPLLDDDIYRYRWDGKVLAHGQNPFAYPPEAPELSSLQEGDPLFDRIGFRDIPAVYPPASQALFAAGYLLNPDGIWGIKILIALCDGAVVLALIGLLRALGRPPELAALYAWNPLVLKEFANSGHHDAAGIALLVLGLWALAAGRRGRAVVPLALATLVKPILLLLAPGLWGRLRLRDGLLWGALLVAAYLPFLRIGPQRLFAGTTLYTHYWEMNDSLFALIQAAFGGPVPSRHPGFLLETNPAARLSALFLWLLAALTLLYDARRERRGLPLTFGPSEGGTLRAFWRMAVLLAVVLALTPTMDPWYVCWLVPFLCLFSWETGLLLTGTVALSYLYYWQGSDFWWLRPLEYIPLVFWGVGEFVRSRRANIRSNTNLNHSS